MTTARDSILGNIRNSLNKRNKDESPEVAERLRARPVHTVPGRATGAHEDLVARFVEEAERNGATVARISDATDLSDAVADYLADLGEDARIRMSPHPLLQNALAKQTRLDISEGPTNGADPVGLTAAFGGIAETGTLVLKSGPASPITLNFLPDTNIVLLVQSRIVGGYEDAWAVLREDADGAMPRAVNWITGPSRSADIEQTLLMGAHGPRRLHIVMLDDKKK